MLRELGSIIRVNDHIASRSPHSSSLAGLGIGQTLLLSAGKSFLLDK
jgi:hypothetical protein